MKKLLTSILCVVLVAMFALLALASGDSETANQGSGAADSSSKAENSSKTDEANSNTADTELGDYSVEIVSCRLAKDYEDKPAVIVKYKFTNNSDEATSFMLAFSDKVYQSGIELSGAVIIDDKANFDSQNQLKEIKKGATIEVETAYTLNDTTTDIEVEVEELFSFNSKKITKTFSIK